MPGDDDPQAAEGPQPELWEVRCRTVVEPVYYVHARNSTEAQTEFQKRLASGEVVVPGTPQGGPHYAKIDSLPRFDDFQVDLSQDTTGGSVFRVTHKLTGITGSGFKLDSVIDHVRTEVAKRGQRAKAYANPVGNV